ncbi:hypothetical protein SAMN06309944_0999 [Micrococcales bacterium KH10]|nr:hypothetical protein SAMN06309944_0999 [Micrococcales bacterium KH10]
MSSYHQQRETRSRIIFTVLIIAVSVAITYGLIRLTLPSLTGQTTTTNDNSITQTIEKEETKDLPRGDAKRVADLDRLAAALKTYKEQHGGYPISTGTCAGGSFDGDADLSFLADLEREAVIDAIPRDTGGVIKSAKAERGTSTTTAAEECDTMYGAKHYLYYSNGTKFALIASVDDADAIPDDAAGVYLAEGDREWFDGSALIADWHWSRNVYIVSNQKLAAAAGE